MKKTLHKNEIQDLLPYRAPFLFVDRVVEISNEHIVISKTFALDDPLISGHLIGHSPLVPGVLLIEMVGQGAYLHQLTVLHETGDIKLLGQCKARFSRPTIPGEEIIATIKIAGQAVKGKLYLGTVISNERTVAEIELLAVSSGI